MLNLNFEPWEKQSACSDPLGWDWFSENELEQTTCGNFCRTSCPVQKECLTFALKNEHINGTWGGCTEDELRILLGVDEYGDPFVHEVLAWCPMCAGVMERPPNKEREKVKRGQFWITCKDCGYGFARYETSDSPYATPLRPRTKETNNNA